LLSFPSFLLFLRRRMVETVKEVLINLDIVVKLG